ncbi:hypothetical protein N7516_004289 [Penicillium verrucosum]|uniref:uncharacterized protein n=1 Tax=Penicillium verrucosum TaxID=60171 RepID=UPI002544E88C|nr:uncharacterized protein N7516_004289 [Penicillium verrucosum]KAJ5944121.1 hypothetical protein N7516_004289 [Penicillium verrucosum]
MAETRSSPEVIAASIPTLDVRCEKKFEYYDVSQITHIVVHLSDKVIRNLKNITNSDADPSSEEDCSHLIGKMLSVTFFGNENQLEWLDTERVGKRRFVAFTNTEKKEKGAQSLSPMGGKLQVVEVMFMRTSPPGYTKNLLETRQSNSPPAVYDLVEMVRVHVMRARSNVVPRKKGPASS